MNYINGLYFLLALLTLSCVSIQDRESLSFSVVPTLNNTSKILSSGILNVPNGLAQAVARIKIKDNAIASSFKLLALPLAWDSARVTLHSQSANGLFSESNNARIIPRLTGFATGTGMNTGYQVATVVFPPLRPSNDYRAEISLANPAGTIITARLAGGQSQIITLNGGANNIDFNVSINGQEALYGFQNVTQGNNNTTVRSATRFVSTNFVGFNSSSGTADGNGSNAKFNRPDQMTTLSDGRLAILDVNNAGLRVADLSKNVTTLATGLAWPSGVVQHKDGSVLVGSSSNYLVKRVTLGGVVTTYAGSGTNATVDGIGAAVSLMETRGMCISPDNNYIYVVTGTGSTYHIRRIDTTTQEWSSWTTLGFTVNSGVRYNLGTTLYGPIIVSPDGQFLYFTGSSGLHRINLLTLAYNTVSGLGFIPPGGLAWDAEGNLLIASETDRIIKKINLSTNTTSNFFGTGVPGDSDGDNTNARFGALSGIVRFPNTGKIFVSQLNAHKLRELTPEMVPGNIITKDDTIVLDTGISNNQPGVNSVELSISGAAYGGATTPVLIKRFNSTEAGSWSQYSWNTQMATEAYTPSALVGGSGTSTQPGQIDVKAYDRYGQVIGVGSFTIYVHNRPDITIRIQ
jgi:hypothetical protein